MKAFRKIMLFGWITFGGIFSQITAQDQDVEKLAEMSLEELLNMEISSASKLAQRTLEAPSIVSVWTASQIRQYGWQTINDVLYSQPGFTPSQDYDRRTVTGRGMFEGWNNNHLLMLIDGVPFNDNLYGSAYTWDITPIAFTQSMEIIRGPGSALYGSNATNGVIAINTLAAPSEGQMFGNVSGRIGNRGTRVLDLVSGISPKYFSAVLAYSTYSTAGNEYLSYDGSGRMSGANFTKYQTNDNRNSHYLFFKLQGKSNLKNLTFQFHEQYWDYATGHGWLWYIPDLDESMKENRRIMALSYKLTTNKIQHEYTARYQNHQIDWNMRFFPDSNAGYDNGGSEYLRSGAQDIFLRTQWTYEMPSEASLIVAAEGDYFWYGGDRSHYSNMDLNSTYGPNPGNQYAPVGPWLAWIKNNPVISAAVFGQLTSGKLLGSKLSATLGARYDRQSFKFNALDATGKESKSFSQLSPRLGLVYLINKDFSLKALAGRAFRAPSPTELFGANTYTLGSNTRKLKPEIITTFELGGDIMLSRNLNWRANVYNTKFENQIAYSVSNFNLSTNLYTLETVGLETEMLYEINDFSGFVNYAFAKRIDEKILDSTIAASDKKLTWAPSHTINFGVNYRNKAVNTSVVGHYQGQVERRSSDLGNASFNSLRGNAVDAWFSVDVRAAYQVREYLEVNGQIKNLLNQKNTLVKNMSYPFDYRGEQRQISIGMELKY